MSQPSVIILAAGFLGLLGSHLVPGLFSLTNDHSPSSKRPQQQKRARLNWRMLRVTVVCLALWITPLLIAGITRG